MSRRIFRCLRTLRELVETEAVCSRVNSCNKLRNHCQPSTRWMYQATHVSYFVLASSKISGGSLCVSLDILWIVRRYFSAHCSSTSPSSNDRRSLILTNGQEAFLDVPAGPTPSGGRMAKRFLEGMPVGRSVSGLYCGPSHLYRIPVEK